MKIQITSTRAAFVACLVIASSAASHAQTLIDLNIDPTGDNGQAVLGGPSDTYNNVAAPANSAPVTAGGLFLNALTSTGASSGIAISTTSGFNVYQTSSGTTPNPGFLMDGYAYSLQMAAQAS